MFAPLKALTAVALASAIGSVLLIAQPFGQQGGLLPGAAEPSPAASVDRGGVKGDIVTATQRCDPDSFSGFIQDEAAAAGSGTWSLECTHTASDPRVTGPLMVTVIYDLSTPNGTGQGILVADIALQGPDGDWTGREYRTIIDPATGPGRVLWILGGNGAYEGWVYIASADFMNDAATFFDYDTSGVIYEGALPPSFWPEG
jgi:hypothetical protein